MVPAQIFVGEFLRPSETCPPQRPALIIAERVGTAIQPAARCDAVACRQAGQPGADRTPTVSASAGHGTRHTADGQPWPISVPGRLCSSDLGAGCEPRRWHTPADERLACARHDRVNNGDKPRSRALEKQRHAARNPALTVGLTERPCSPNCILLRLTAKPVLERRDQALRGLLLDCLCGRSGARHLPTPCSHRFPSLSRPLALTGSDPRYDSPFETNKPC
jgi:hypothetical protein